MYVFEYAEAHGIRPSESIRQIYETDTVLVKGTITFEQIAEITGVPKEEVKVLNPSYKLGIIPKIKNKNYSLRLPVSSIGPFVANEAALYEKVKKDLENRKKEIYEDDLIALMRTSTDPEEDRIKLVSMHVVCGTEGPNQARMTLNIEGEEHRTEQTRRKQ